MLSLENLNIWKKLSGPCGTSDKIPELIKEFHTTLSEDILNEICWDFIYHQNTLYQSTFATIPHLTEAFDFTSSKEFQWNFFINLGLVVVEVTEEQTPEQLFKSSKFEKNIILDIINSYYESVKKLKVISEHILTDYHEKYSDKDDVEKTYLMASLAAINKKYDIAQLFATYTYYDEYNTLCPKCKSELYFEVENNCIFLYKEDPVFEKNQEKGKIIPFSEDFKLSKELLDKKKWLHQHAELLGIQELQRLLAYFFGKYQCGHCKNESIAMQELLNY